MRSTISLLAAACLLLGGAASTVRAADPPPMTRDPLASSQVAELAGVWLGEFRQFDPGRFLAYPMRMEVSVVEGADGPLDQFVGSLHWPTLRDSVTTLRGWRDGNMLRFTEERLVQGSDVVLHGNYRASFRNPDRIEGIWYHTEDPATPGFGSFVLQRTALPRLGLPQAGWLGEGP